MGKDAVSPFPEKCPFWPWLRRLLLLLLLLLFPLQLQPSSLSSEVADASNGPSLGGERDDEDHHFRQKTAQAGTSTY